MDTFAGEIDSLYLIVQNIEIWGNAEIKAIKI